jgi:hypothetical protein
MSWLPGWNSIEGSAKWGDIFFWAGFSLLVLLAACIVMSKVYGWRKDALITVRNQLIAIAGELQPLQAPQAQPQPGDQIEQQEQRERAAAQERRDAEAPGARVPDEPAERGAAEPPRQPDRIARLQERPPRALTEAQKKSVIGALSPLRGQKFSVVCIANDAEGKSLAGEIVSVLRAAGWDFPEGAVAEAAYSKEPIGLSVMVNAGQALAPSMLRPTSMLVKAFADIGLMQRDGALADPNIPRDRIEIRVGRNRNPP